MTADDHDFARGPHRGRGPVATAYTATGALELDCPNCGRPHGQYCVHKGTDVERRMPCPERLPHNPDTGGNQ